MKVGLHVGTKIRAVSSDMSALLRQAVEKYSEITGSKTLYKKSSDANVARSNTESPSASTVLR